MTIPFNHCMNLIESRLAHYNAENDVNPANPMVSYNEMILMEAVKQLAGKIADLENQLQELIEPCIGYVDDKGKIVITRKDKK